MKAFKIIGIVLFLALSGHSWAQEKNILEQLQDIAIVDQKIMMPMRDGVRLATDIYRPKTDNQVPIIFSRTPYNFNSYRDGELVTRTMQSALEAVQKGYAYVVQNDRGRFFSEGEWDILGTPLTDGYDAFTWMADQTWSNVQSYQRKCQRSQNQGQSVFGHRPYPTLFIHQSYGKYHRRREKYG